MKHYLMFIKEIIYPKIKILS